MLPFSITLRPNGPTIPMPQSLARIWLHVTFSTAGRRAFLQDEDIREEMFSMLGHHAKEIGCPPAG